MKWEKNWFCKWACADVFNIVSRNEIKMRVAIIGHFGGNKMFNDGQTIKTKMLYNALMEYGIKAADKVDTYYIRHNPLYFICCFIVSMFKNKKYIILLSENGRKTLFPTFFLMSKILNKEIYHYAIGGNLAREIENGKQKLKYINSFKWNWVESRKLAKRLQGLGVKNALYLPNFKDIPVLKSGELLKEFSEPYSFCTFSRVIREKGIEDAVEAIHKINLEAGRCIVKLDIYGPIEEHYAKDFYKVVSMYDEARYCGVIPAEKSVSVVKNYYMLLFPTKYLNEGIPGTIIDAFASGVPVIASRWENCDEMIENGVNGYVYDFGRQELLKDMILYAVSHLEETVKMRERCLKRAEQYSKAYVVGMIIEQMGN